MRNSKLSEHDFKKGKFTTSFSRLMKEHGQENIWFLDRLPEYMWLLLILHQYGRKEGIERCVHIFSGIHRIAPQVDLPKMSTLLALDEDIQKDIYERIIDIITVDTISPLSVIFTHSKYPCFAEHFSTTSLSVESRLSVLQEVLSESADHQSQISTDARFLVIYYGSVVQGNFVMSAETAELVSQYPRLSHEDEIMCAIRPMIRAMEIGQPNSDKAVEYLKQFWEALSEMDDCQLVYKKCDSNTETAKEFVAALKDVMQYYSGILVSISPLDSKLTVLLGIATYAYKRIIEMVEHNLYMSISGRGTARCITECFIMMKYLLQEESSHQNIWTEYQYYGIGQYKLVVERILESGKNISGGHVDASYLDALVQEYIDKEFIDMDTSYFGKKSVREKAIIVGEKELFDFYYDYDSAFEHGLWGAIRESSMLKCTSPTHQYHCVPDIENTQKLPDVWKDCRDTMIKIVDVLKSLYGLPEHLYIEVTKYEK